MAVRKVRMAWLALPVLFALPLGSAGAQSAGPAGPGSTVQTAPAASPPAAPSMSGPLPGTAHVAQPRMGPPAPGSPEDTQVDGPALPRPHRGKLAPIDWPKAPEAFPEALEQAVNLVTRNYPTTGSARAALRAAAQDLRTAQWLRLPSLSANVTYLNRYYNSPTPQVIVQAPVWTGGRIEASVRRARATEDASSAQYLDTVHSLALTTVQTYFDIVRLTQREQLLTGSLKEHQRLVDTMKRRYDQDVSPLADLELAKSRTAQVEQDLNLSRAQRETSLRIMAQLIADPSYDIGPIPWYNPELDVPNPDALEEQAVAYSPLLRRLQAESDVSRADLSTRKASLLPQLDAQYSYDDFYGHRVGGVVRVQNDPSQFTQISAARARIDAADESRRSSELQLRREVASDLIEFRAAKERATISHLAAEATNRVSESFMRQFIAGRRSWLDVMNELREAVTAQISESEAKVTVMATATRLAIETGRWRPKFDPAAP